MKKASKYLKQLFSAIIAAVKERSTAMRTRTSAMRTRLIIFGILRNKKLLMSAINSKIHAIMGGGHDGGKFTSNHGGAEGEGRGAGEYGYGNGHHFLEGGGGGGRKAAVLQSLPSFVVEQEKRAIVMLNSLPSFAMDQDGGGDYGEQQYDVLARSPLVGGDEEDNEGGKQQLANAPPPSGSVIDLVHGAAEHGGAEFRLEDEIDHAADVFIRRFHDQMKLQKLESFKRFCEMFERN